MLRRKKERSPDDFWREYEEKTGEKVLARGLGQYLSGWEEFDSKEWTAVWGLVIATSGGFRFHHFPQQNWLAALTSFAGAEAAKEKTIFIPNEKIVSARIVKETSWWKKLLRSSQPKIVISYRDESDTERQLLLEADTNSADIAEKLNAVTREQGSGTGDQGVEN